MSTLPVPVATATAVATPVPAAPKSAIQLIEEQIVGLIKQREQAIANVHAVEGALQGAQHLVGLLKAEAAKAEVAAKELAAKVEAEAKNLLSEAKAEITKVVDAVEAEAKKL